ncbi:MAG: hypothetical protein PUB39_01220 [Eubacteriales bacterium]|nr:hypothetical protein [Eubacteriales bacterium]
MKNLEWNIYTYKHRRAFKYTVEKLIHEPKLREEMLKRAEVHDMDKMVLYLFYDQHTAQMMHVKSQPHHLENNKPKSYEDLVETVIDYECAPYTKPDKPWNAYDFITLLYSMRLLDEEIKDRLMAITAELGIDRSGTSSNDLEGMKYIESLGEITEDMIYDEILKYVNNYPDNELNRIILQKVSDGSVPDSL